MPNTTAHPDTRRSDSPTSRNEIFTVEVDSIDDGLLEVDLYLDNRRDERLVLYRAVGVEFTQAHRQTLRNQGVGLLYVPISQRRAYQRMFTGRLERIYSDQDLVRSERIRLIRGSCAKIIDDALRCPNQSVPFGLVAEVGATFAKWASQDWQGFAHLMDMAEHDYYTVTHMVNVGVGCGVLTRRLVPEQPDLARDAIHGGLLHDLGKRDIPEEVLNKEGRLDAREWELVQAHPRRGRELLERDAGVPYAVRRVAEFHHERVDGSGYPNGIRGDQIDLLVRVCAVVDAFDAICSARPYRAATSPAQAVAILRDGIDTHFDGRVTECWCDIVGELYQIDPQGSRTDEVAAPVLVDFIQQAPAPVGLCDRRVAARSGKQRRRHTRYVAELKIIGRFVWQGKDYPVKIGTWTEFETRDVSRSGLQIVTPWPLAINDVMEFQLPTPGGRKATRMAVVIRVRKTEQNEWSAGLMFVRERPTSS